MYNSTNEKIKSILREILETRESYNRRSRNAYLEELKPGEPAPREGMIYGDKFKEEYRNDLRKYQQQLHEILGDAEEGLKLKSTEAPTPEAVNAITLFGMRDSVTADEVSSMLKRYGSNPLCYNAISQTARKSGVYGYEDNPVLARMAIIDDLSKSLDRLLNDQIFTSYPEPISSALISMIEVNQVDAAFPEE